MPPYKIIVILYKGKDIKMRLLSVSGKPCGRVFTEKLEISEGKVSDNQEELRKGKACAIKIIYLYIWLISHLNGVAKTRHPHAFPYIITSKKQPILPYQAT